MKIMHKKIIILLLLLMAFIPRTVSATIKKGNGSETCTNYIKDMDDGTGFISKYGISLQTKQDKFVLKITKSKMSAAAKKEKDVKFKIVKIATFSQYDDYDNPIFDSEITSAKVIKNDYILSNDNALVPGGTLNVKLIAKPGVAIFIEPDGFSDSELTKKCGSKAYFTVLFTGFPAEGDIPETDDVTDKEIKSPDGDDISSKKIIDCNNYKNKGWSTSGFNYQFCDVKTKAIQANGGEKSNSVTQKLKCDVTKWNYTSDYYVNKTYLWKTKTKNIKNEKVTNEDGTEQKLGNLVYYYNYTCGNKNGDPQNVGSCKLTCEEAVIVEYGPPIASKAGLCFEYKVKVTSRVSCGVDQYPPKPTRGKLCTPSPQCTVPGSGIVHTQGGPNEDFDACIQSCDGGSYSDKCSNFCYQKVYGDSSVKKTSGYELNYADKLNSVVNSSTVEQVRNGATTHEYYCDSNNNIIWNTGPTGLSRDSSMGRGNPNDPRWHREHSSWGISPMSGYQCYSATGIPRRCNCGETCTWTKGSCSSVTKSYMNPGEATDAYNDNVDRYNNYVKYCNRAATCTTTTATFTISTSVGKTKYTFPYSTDADQLQYKGLKTKKTILSNKGCYSSDDSEDLSHEWYLAEWSFPGTFIHNKTGEISYENKIENSGWQKVDKKFCLPLNAPSVNQKWWNYYYTKESSGSKTYSFETTEYKDNCPQTCRFTTVSSIAPGDISKWNINAVTKKFGHYGWNITISCFYALNNNVTLTTKKCTVPECKTSNPQAYRIRSVDLGNLFPNPDGSSISNYTEIGRAPGFNWSSSAKNTVKDPKLKSNASTYAKAVQKKADKVYNSSSELDYHIYLTKDIIKKIKSTGQNYTSYSGSTSITNVSHYQSDLIRNVIGATEIPQPGDLQCNNLLNRKCSTNK